MASKLDIIVFGATGFTGKCVVLKLHKLAKNVKWGVAGRNEHKLKDIVDETAKKVGVSDVSNIQVIVADVDSEDSIKKMTAQAKVIINCCGPYNLYGEVVVKSCIETGTHYVDVTGEKHFVTEMLAKYAKLAEDKGIYIVNACGFSCVVADIGICFMEDNFAGTINSVEIYISNGEENGNTPGPVTNYGTWASIVDSMGKLRNMRKNTFQSKLPEFKPKLSTKFLHKVDGGWAVPFPGNDDFVFRSQQYFYENGNKRPIQMINYLVIPSLLNIIVTGIFLLFTLILAQFKFGRDLLLKYPEFFSNGLCSHLVDIEKMEQIRFLVKLNCRGWSDKLPDGQDQYHTPPNKEMIGCISGSNPGYGFTAIATIICALMFLRETKNLPSKGGVYTPAIAFSKTSLIKELQSNGVVFEILSTKDI